MHKIPVCRVSQLKKTISYLSEAGLTVIGCTEKAEKKMSDQSLNGPMAIIMGSEEDGIVVSDGAELVEGMVSIV